MTIIGSGGVIITSFQTTKSFDKDFKKLSPEITKLLPIKLADLKNDPRPHGLRFEKLKGYSNPAIYSVHITGNYKLSFEIQGNVAILRRIGCHNDIDRAP